MLGEMDDAFGTQLHGKVDCIGLHGDYNAGLQFIREGKLPSIRHFSPMSSFAVPPMLKNGIPQDLKQTGSETPRNGDVFDYNQSPQLSAESDSGIVPDDASPMPSAITETESASVISRLTTWSPIDDNDDGNPVRSDCSSGTSADRPLHFLFLGSSLGNFERESAAPFLRSIPLRPGDTLLIGLDGRPSPGEAGRKKVEVAYNDPSGHTRAFEEHGWEVVRQELGLTDDAGVEFVGRYNEVLGRHEAYFRSRDQQTLHLPLAKKDVKLEKGELLNIEWSYKVSSPATQSR